MAEEEKTTSLLNKIEKLIVDGQKEILDRVGNLEHGQKEVIDKLEKVEGGLVKVEKRVDSLDKKLDAVHDSLKTEIKVTAYAIKDEIKDKIHEHLRLAHV